MSKHTPRPWVRCAKAPKIIMSWSVIEGHEGYIIGSVCGNDSSGFYADEAEAEANACLIAAAPDLLEALQGLLIVKSEPDDLICCTHPDCGCMGATLHQQAEHYARAAIAKATGEQP